MGSPLTVIMRKVKEISTQLAAQLKKSLVELPNSSVSQNILQNVPQNGLRNSVRSKPRNSIVSYMLIVPHFLNNLIVIF